MANTDSPRGFRLVGSNGQTPPSIRPYWVSSAYGTALFVGDAVLKQSTANNVVVEGFPVGTLPEVQLAAVTGDVTGVIVGFSPLRSDLEKKHNPASTERIAYVCDDPEALFEVQDDASATLGVAGVGLNVSAKQTHSGSTATGLSGAEIDASTAATTAGLQWKIVRASKDLSNDATSTWAKWFVRMNDSTEVNAAAGI